MMIGNLKSLKSLIPWVKPSSELKKKETSSDSVQITQLMQQNQQLIQLQAQAITALASSLQPIANYFQGSNIKEVMHAKAKADFIAHAIGAAINDLGLDARRMGTYSTELSELVEKVYNKIEEKEKSKEPRDPELHNAETDYEKWINKHKERNG